MGWINGGVNNTKLPIVARKEHGRACVKRWRASVEVVACGKMLATGRVVACGKRTVVEREVAANKRIFLGIHGPTLQYCLCIVPGDAGAHLVGPGCRGSLLDVTHQAW
ncbi:hypothetical protein O6H91_18G058700 [Diphasiastrum complanatum]|uniref:Uncharacterized protein n=1 Tax=Diphasiastrum complanatum TaxID=34168 RepID=A0ACC2B1N8_DIPCM|nr:hypothetical protein O6H91_18G058700 [Diphasiastrum complanatum]